MKLVLRVIKIEVKVVKVGFVVFIDNLLGEVTEIIDNNAIVHFGDDTDESISLDIVRVSIAKFLAQTPDLRTYPLVHNDFKNIIYMLPTREKCKGLLEGKARCEGNFKNVFSSPTNNDVIEITNIDVIERFNLTNKLDRIGIISGRNGNYYVIHFYNGTECLSRKDFRILSREDSHQVFMMAD